jgi:ATP/ADP translocase
MTETGQERPKILFCYIGRRMTIVQKINHWLPVALCVFLIAQHDFRESAFPQNLKYLSMWQMLCFFFVGLVTYRMQKEIRKLRETVQELQMQQKDFPKDI